MRFLCLHGYGTSSEIFQQQLAGISTALGDHHEYVYLDGEISVTRTGTVRYNEQASAANIAEELAGMFHGKTFGYYDSCESQQVERAHGLVADLLADEELPFDAVLANSQGASLAVSYLIHQQIQHPDQPPPFRFAVFFTPGIVVSPDPKYKDKEIMSFLDKLDQNDIDKILAGLLDRNGKAMIEPETFTGFHNLLPKEQELCLKLVCLTHCFC